MKRWVGFTAILFLLALTAGCPYTAKAPLGTPDRHSFNKQLIGLWKSYNVDNEADSTFIFVVPFNDAEYHVDMGGKSYRAFIFKIGGKRFLHFNRLSMDPWPLEYFFARYSFSANEELSVRFVGRQIVPKALETKPKALRAFLASHLADSALYDKDLNLLLRRP
jgi:hypothetical protein